ncbi:MAG: hypothetical protein ACE37F_26965 [Nannocystaceae bacterium]|nr:hypothetical protein [bacterium]
MFSGFGNPKDDQYLYDIETETFTHVPLSINRSSCAFDSDIDCETRNDCVEYCASATNGACPGPSADKSEYSCVSDVSTPDPFCSGHTHWVDGNPIVQGGNATGSSGGGGPRSAWRLVDETWSFEGLLSPFFGRWYPSLTTMGDGRIILHGGDFVNNSITIWDFAAGTSQQRTAHPIDQLAAGKFFYPFTFQMTDGRLFVGGQEGAGAFFRDGWIFDPATLQYDGPFTSAIPGGSAVMYEPDQVMKSGGCSSASSRCIPTDATQVIDVSIPEPEWAEKCPMPQQRHFQTLTLLPDGTVLMTGGNSEGNGDSNATFYCREPSGVFTNVECDDAGDCCASVDGGSGGGCNETCEEWDNTFYATRSAALWWPWTGHWFEFGEQVHERMYHSTAILVPDGRVLTAGNGQRSQLVNQTEVEFFSPPYKFWGPAPEIEVAPDNADYDSTIAVDVSMNGEMAPPRRSVG